MKPFHMLYIQYYMLDIWYYMLISCSRRLLTLVAIFVYYATSLQNIFRFRWFFLVCLVSAWFCIVFWVGVKHVIICQLYYLTIDFFLGHFLLGVFIFQPNVHMRWHEHWWTRRGFCRVLQSRGQPLAGAIHGKRKGIQEGINSKGNIRINLDDILLPIINRDGDGDGKSDISKYENHVFEFLIHILE